MSQVLSNINETDKVFDSFSRAFDVIDYLQKLAFKAAYVFRGYNRQDQLKPGIIREGASYVKLEEELLLNFERYGSHYFHANTPIDFLSYAQHFGLPTRLLDFTHNPFIALSFALNGTKSNGRYTEPDDKNFYYIRYAAIDKNLYVNSLSLNEDLYNNRFIRTDSFAIKSSLYFDKIAHLFSTNDLQLTSTVLDGKNCSLNEEKIRLQMISDHRILFIDPNQANQRIIMQQGLFMLPYTLNEQEHLEIIRRNTSVIKIHKDLRDDLLSILETMGFTSYRLMPDLASVCEAVKRKVMDERIAKNVASKG